MGFNSGFKGLNIAEFWMCLYSSLTQAFSFMYAKFWMCLQQFDFLICLQTFFFCVSKAVWPTFLLYKLQTFVCVCRYRSVTLVSNSIKNSQQVSLSYSHGMTPFVICVFDRWPGTAIRISSAAFVSNFNNSRRLAVRSKPFIILRTLFWSGSTFFATARRDFFYLKTDSF